MKDKNQSYVLYKHVNKTNHKVYIGITCQRPSRRWQKDGAGYKPKEGCETYFYNAILYWGWNGFDHIIIREGLTREQAIFAERQLIIFYQSRNPQYGYNETLGGDCGAAGVKDSDETKRRKSEAALGKKKTKEHAENISKGLTGRKLSKSHVEKMSKRVRNKTTGEEYDSCHDVERKTGIPFQAISRVCSGERTKTHGYEWEYIDG